MSIQYDRSTQSAAIQTSVLFLIAVLVSVAGFHGALFEQIGRWGRQEEYSHGFLIPALAIWLLWARRDALLASIGRPAWSGFFLVLLATAMHVIGELSSIFILSQLGFIVALIGMVLGIGGYSLLKVTFVPIAILVFAIPLPYFIDSSLSWRLQLLSSELGATFIRLFNIPVLIEGNVIDLGHYKLQVVDACSGLRYLYPLLSLGFLGAYLFHAPMWQRIVVFLSTVPITILMNSFRIGVIGIIVDRWGAQNADGFLHAFEGWIIFVACAGLLAAEIYLFARLSGRKFFDTFYLPIVRPSLPTKGRGARSGLLPLTACFMLLCIGGFSVYFLGGRQEIIPERSRFLAFPSTLGKWSGRPSSLEPQIEHSLGLEDYILADYRQSVGANINLYVAYYATQRKGVSPHSPTVCIPGGGWLITRFERTSSGTGLHSEIPFNRVVIERDSTKQIVYYWFDQRGRKIANEYLSKWHLFADAIVKNRTDGALVRLTTQVNPGESEQQADDRLLSFMQDLVPTLAQYLPSDMASESRPTLSSTNASRL